MFMTSEKEDLTETPISIVMFIVALQAIPILVKMIAIPVGISSILINLGSESTSGVMILLRYYDISSLAGLKASI